MERCDRMFIANIHNAVCSEILFLIWKAAHKKGTVISKPGVQHLKEQQILFGLSFCGYSHCSRGMEHNREQGFNAINNLIFKEVTFLNYFSVYTRGKGLDAFKTDRFISL